MKYFLEYEETVNGVKILMDWILNFNICLLGYEDMVNGVKILMDWL